MIDHVDGEVLVERQHHEEQADDVEAPVARGVTHGAEVSPAVTPQSAPAVDDAVEVLLELLAVHADPPRAPLQPGDDPAGAPAQRGGVAEEPEPVGGEGEDERHEEGRDDRGGVSAAAAER